MGLTSATALVMGSIVGTGVFTMPAVLVVRARLQFVVLAVIAAGGRRRDLFRRQGLPASTEQWTVASTPTLATSSATSLGHLVGWRDWIESWAGNAAIVSLWVFYVDPPVQVQPPEWHGESGHRNVRTVDPSADQPHGRSPMAWFQNITAFLKSLFAALRGCCWLASSSRCSFLYLLTHRAAVSTTDRHRRWRCAVFLHWC